MKGLLELRLNSEGGYIEIELGVEWPCSAIQFSFNWWLCHHGASNSYLRSHAWGNLRFFCWCLRWLRLLGRWWRLFGGWWRWHRLWRWLCQINWLRDLCFLLWRTGTWFLAFGRARTGDGKWSPCIIAPGRRTGRCVLDRRWDEARPWRLRGGILDWHVSWDSQASWWGRRLYSLCFGHGGVGENGRRCTWLAQAEETDGRVLWLGSSWHLFEVQMTV